ncbi:MAG: PAS domain S-box protein [candidate division Zixibacteria bacterium]|nr:PAS domain S-box protein [candidate division Zixibacteria bacterium]
MGIDKSVPRSGLFLPLRLASYVIIMAVVVGWMRYPQYLRALIVAYSVVTLAFALCLAFGNRYRLRRATYVLTGLQFFLEVGIESAIIYATGNVNSPFSALLVLTVVSAALVYRMVGTLVIASAVSAAYAFIIWLGLVNSTDHDLSMQALRTIFSTNESVFYSIFLHILIFYLTAFMSGYLAERLSNRDQELVDASLALRRARLETDDILRHLNSGLLTVDSSGFIVYFNRAAERILGYSEEGVKGMTARDAFAERMPELAACLNDGLVSGVAYPRRELDIIDGERRPIPLGLSTSILTEEGGALRGVIAIFSDLTEAKALESKVRVNDRLAAVGELSASIAHEIRNPLAAISGSVEVLRDELELEGANARLMSLILKESQRLNVILTDFLAYARIGRPGYNKVELCHIVGEVRELVMMHQKIPDNIKISLESDDSFVYVIGDEGLIKQLLMNLVMNACEAFDGRPGRVVQRLLQYPEDSQVLLQVSDNGPGIDANRIDHIYEPFFSTKKHGTGLGLAIVHRICDALRLTLQVDSQPGEGTTFTVGFARFATDRAVVAEPGRSPVAPK